MKMLTIMDIHYFVNSIDIHIGVDWESIYIFRHLFSLLEVINIVKNTGSIYYCS